MTKALSVECISNTRCCSRSICGRFNVGKARVLRTVRRVANALINLAPTFIVWPSGQYLEEVKHGFNQMGFPNTIGAVDGTYIRIPQPKKYSLAYICRKNYPCLILQVFAYLIYGGLM